MVLSLGIGRWAVVRVLFYCMEVPKASQSLMQLGMALSDDFTVYIPDRRGRGLSGPFGDNYGIKREVEDMDAILKKTGAQNVFGTATGGIIALQSALRIACHP